MLGECWLWNRIVFGGEAVAAVSVYSLRPVWRSLNGGVGFRLAGFPGEVTYILMRDFSVIQREQV